MPLEPEENDLIKNIYVNADEIFRQNAVGIAAHLEFKGRSTPHHHVMTFLKERSTGKYRSD